MLWRKLSWNDHTMQVNVSGWHKASAWAEVSLTTPAKIPPSSTAQVSLAVRIINIKLNEETMRICRAHHDIGWTSWENTLC